MNVKRDSTIDFMREMAMLSVIMIHVTSVYIKLPSSKTILDMNLAFILNQVSRYSVPLFLLLSGYSLNLNNKSDIISIKQCCSFYLARFKKLLPTYVFWSAVYFLFGNGWVIFSLFSPLFFRFLMLGQAGPHLYFITILVQCYLLYPCIIFFKKKNVSVLLLSSFLSMYFVTQMIWFRKMGLNIIPLKCWPYIGISMLLWSFNFVFGSVLSSLKLNHAEHFSPPMRLTLIVLSIVLCSLCVLEARSTGFYDSDRLSIFLFSCSAYFSLSIIWQYIKKIRFVLLAVNLLSRHTTTVFYSHVLILTVLRRNISFVGTRGFLMLYMLVVILSIFFSFLFDNAIILFKHYCTKRSIPK